jgi:hypothetical protein
MTLTFGHEKQVVWSYSLQFSLYNPAYKVQTDDAIPYVPTKDKHYTKSEDTFI